MQVVSRHAGAAVTVMVFPGVSESHHSCAGIQQQNIDSEIFVSHVTSGLVSEESCEMKKKNLLDTRTAAHTSHRLTWAVSAKAAPAWTPPPAG